MDNKTKTQLKTLAKRVGIGLIVAGLIVIAGNVIQTIRKNDYIGGPGTAKIAVPGDIQDATVLNDKLNKPLKTDEVKMTQIKLRNDRVVQLFDEVNETSAQAVVKQLGKLNQDSETLPITLVINSPGGSVVDGALIVDAMTGSKAPVNTLCIQICASMAAMIHQYGQKRLVLPHAALMFHPAAGGTYGDVDRMASELAFFQRYVGSMELNAAKRANISIEEYKVRANSQIWLTGNESVKAGFADSVVYVSSEDTSKLFKPDPNTVEVNKKNEKKRVRGAFKAFLVQVLGAGIQFINNSGDNSPIEAIRRDFNDVPVSPRPVTSPDSDLKSVK